MTMNPSASLWTGWQNKPSAWALIAANFIPLVGIMLFGWSTFEVIFVYWLENVILGGLNVIRMLTCDPDIHQLDFSSLAGGNEKSNAMIRTYKQQLASDPVGFRRNQHLSKLFFIPFFCVHYGIFCLVHGMFVVMMFGSDFRQGFGPAEPEEAFQQLAGSGWYMAALGLFLSHLYSLITNYYGRGEYRRTIVPVLMFQPYGRIIVLHVAIVIGGFLIMGLGSPILALLLFVVLKTGLDLSLHLREHARAETAAPGDNAQSGTKSETPGTKYEF